MSATPKKLKLNIQTLRQLTNQEAGEVVGGTVLTTTLWPTYTCDSCRCSQTCAPATAANEQCCADGTVSTLRWDF